MSAFPWSCEQVIAAMRTKEYKVFEDEFDLNIVGVRTMDIESNKFDDWICIFHLRNNGVWAFYAFQATTDPGLFYREDPINVKGTAILPPGQHRGMWKLGRHRDKYDALVQAREIGVWRDNNCDEILDFGGEVDLGYHGINGHHASYTGTSENVNKWSAGCQVWADIMDFEFAMSLCRKQIEVHPTYTTFTYTLLDQGDLEVLSV